MRSSSEKTGASARPLTPNRLLGLLDKAKAFALLRTYHPEAVQNVEYRDWRAKPLLSDCGAYEVRLNEAFRFPNEDTLIFQVAVFNKGDKPLQHAPDRAEIRVGEQVYFPSLADLPEIVAPHGAISGYLAVTGSHAIYSTTNPAPQAGKYTVVIPPDSTQTDGTATPQGTGAGTLTVTATGQMTCVGKLADGTAFTQGAVLARNGIWYLYLPLYAKTGSTAGMIEGTIRFENLAGVSDLDGAVTWVNALLKNSTGASNIALGYNAGSVLTTGSNNIDIGHVGVVGESAIIRIGDGVTQTDTYLTGVIHGNGSGLTGIPSGNLSGSITAGQIATGAVGSTQLASGLTLGGTTSGTFSGNLAGNATTATSTINFTGSLSGNVTGTQSATVVSTVGGVTATNVAAGVILANAATAANTVNTIVLRDPTGSFTAGTITVSGTFSLPTTSSSTVGVITQGGSPLIHTYGTINFFAGTGAGNFVMTGNGNNAVGFQALQNNTTGNDNTAMGVSALAANTTGSQNTANGFQALSSNTTGYSNTASGNGTLLRNTTGILNTAIGLDALYFNTTGLNNTASGVSPLESNTTAGQNVAIGNYALYSQSYSNSGTAWSSNNIAVGYHALYANQPTSTSTGINNTGLGTSALSANTTGVNNIAVGYNAGSNLTTGSSNIDIGSAGVTGEFAIIRIGDGVTQTDTYLTGVIHGNGSGLTGISSSTLTGTITSAQIATGAVTSTQIAVGAVGSTQLAANVTLTGAVTASSFNGNGAGLTNIPATAVSAPPPGMAFIPAGAFTMGDSLDGETDAIPTVSTTVSAFYMDVNLVSLSQWQSVYYWATSNGYTFVNAGAGKAANNPVQTVDWYDSVKWCNARSQQAGKTPVYYLDAAFTTVYTTGEPGTVYPNWAAAGYRLPTEAEWEKASRGGLSGQRFPWGNTINENLANYYGATASYSYDLGPNGYNTIGSVGGASPATSPVGSFALNGYGLYDMAGNVLEWCWDWYGTPYAGGTDPRGPATGSDRVLRGGFWFSYASNARCALRNHSSPSNANNIIGFRAVLAPGQ